MPAPSPAVTVGAAIAKARMKAGMTQQELAEALGLACGTGDISRVESGEHEPRLGKILKIAKILGVEPVELLPV